MGSLAGQRLRRQLRAEYKAQHRRIGWRYVPAVLVYCALFSLVIAWLAWTIGEQAAWFGAGVGVGVAPLMLWLALHTPEAQRLDSAAFAEEWVEEQLDVLARDRWRAHHNISFDGRDVDHVAIGPGGVVVIETKWSDRDLFETTSISRRIIEKYERQLERNVQAVDRLLKQFGSDARTRRGLLAVGGPHRPDGPIRTANGVLVVPISGLADHLRRFPTQLTDDEVEQAHGALATYVDRRARHDATHA